MVLAGPETIPPPPEATAPVPDAPDFRRPSRIRRWFSWQIVICGVIAALIIYLAVVPLAYLMWGTFYNGASLTFEFFRSAYTAYNLDTMLWNSLQFSVGTTIISVVLGTFLAYLAVRTDLPFKRLVFAISLIPLIIPGILHTIAWIFLASPRSGFLNTLLEPIFGRPAFDIFTMGGMIFVEGLHLAPLVFLLMYAAFRSMDPSLEESALASGARLPTVFRRITLPLVKPALYAAILITMVRVLEAFETPALLGIPSGIWVFTSRIWRVLNTYPADFGQAGAYAMTLLAITTVGVYWNSRLTKKEKSFQTVTGKGFRPRPMELGRFKWPALVIIFIYFIVAVVLPLGMLVYVSLQPFYSQPSLESLGSITWKNYAYVFQNEHTLTSLRNSFILGVGSATFVMFIMSIASWIVVRTKIRGRWLLDNLSFLPLSIPGLVMGVALLFVYLRMPIPIYGSLWILFIAYVTRYMPYGMRYASTSMYQIGGELEESGRASGASWWQIFRKINLPLLFPGLMAGWIYILLVSVRELSSSILLYSPGDEVLAIEIWQLWENGQVTQLSALGVVMVLALTALVLLAQKLGANVGTKN